MSLFSILKKSKTSKSNQSNPMQEIVHNFCKWHGVRGETEFYHQPEEYQMRANPENKLTLGMLLHTTIDVRKGELSDLYVVYDYQNGVGEMIKNENDIWYYDLCSHLIERTDEGYSYKDGRVVLIVAYKMNKDDIDHSISRRYGTITVHLGKQQGGSLNSEDVSSFYICATICMSPLTLEKHHSFVNDYEKLQPKALSVTFAFDTSSSTQKQAEYEYLHKETLEKIAKNKWDELTVRERFLVETIIPDIGSHFYSGGKALEEKRFWDAIIYFTKVYDALQERWIKETITDEERNVFFDTCYNLGFCFCELELYEKAIYYLDIVFSLNNIDYKMEYINCLTNKKDFRAFHVVAGEIDRISNLDDSEYLPEHANYYRFLLRRIAYLYIDKGKLDKAEEILKEMLNRNQDEDFAIRELAYIQEIKKRGNINHS